MTLTALVLVSCVDDSQPSPGDVTGPVLSVTASNDQLDRQQDTYLNQTDKNHAYGAEVVTSLRESAKNRILLQFDEETITGAGNFLDAVEFGRVFLTLTIAENTSDWGPGRPIDLYLMEQGWIDFEAGDGSPDAGATWNCAVDTNLSNNQPDCAGTDAWDVSKGGDNPWAETMTASTVITTGLTGEIMFDVTADIEAFTASTPRENVGWVLLRRSEDEEGGISFHSFESDPELEAAPHLTMSVCPPGATCGEYLVTVGPGGNIPADFEVDVAEAGDTIAQIAIDAGTIDTLFYANGQPVPPALYPDELIFSLQRVVDGSGNDVKCLGIPDDKLEYGPCWEGEITDPATGNKFDVKFTTPQLFTSCLIPTSALDVETALADVVRHVRRAHFGPGASMPDSGDTASDVQDHLSVLNPVPTGVALNCEDLITGQLDHQMNPVFRLARALWNRITNQVRPRPLQASAMVTTVGHHRTNTSEFPEESFFSWAALQVAYRDGGYKYLTVGRKCDDCLADRVPRRWFRESFNDADWGNGAAAFGDKSGLVSAPGVCTLGQPANITTHWPTANPNFNPPEITQLLLRKSFTLLPFTGDADHPGDVYLEIRAAVYNDLQVYLNGTDVTEYVIPPVNLKRTKGWIETNATCPAYDQVVVRVPENLARFGGTNLLAIRARSTDAEHPSFLDVQVNVVEP
jgi:hypothetical protein